MIIKKYQGKTEEEALAAAKKELGDGVVVMNVKNVKRKYLIRLKLALIVVALLRMNLQKPKPRKIFKQNLKRMRKRKIVN